MIRSYRRTGQYVFDEAAVMGVLPSVVAFLIGQRYLIKGITLTGLKA